METPWFDVNGNVPKKTPRKEMAKLFRRKPRNKTETRSPDFMSSPVSSPNRDGFEEGNRSFYNRGYEMSFEEDETEDHSGVLIQPAPYIRPKKGDMQAREDAPAEDVEQPDSEDPNTVVTWLTRNKRIANARNRLERGKVEEPSAEDVRRLHQQWEQKSSKKPPTPSGPASLIQTINPNFQNDESPSHIEYNYVEKCTRWTHLDFTSAIHQLATYLGGSEGSSEWCQWLERYYQGQWNHDGLLPSPIPSQSFLPAFHSAFECQRLEESQKYQDAFNLWKGSEVLETSSCEFLCSLNLNEIAVSFFNEDSERVLWGNVDLENPIPRVMSAAAHALYAKEKVLVVLDSRKDWRFRENPHLKRDPGVRFFAAASIISPAGEAIGAVFVSSKRERDSFKVRHRHDLKKFAQTIMDEIENVRLEIESNRYEDADEDSGEDQLYYSRVSRDENEAHYSHARQHSVIDPTLIPGGLNFYKSQPLPTAGFETAGPGNLDNPGFSNGNGNNTPASPNRWSFSSSTNSVSMFSPISRRSFSRSMTLPEHDQTIKSSFHDNVTGHKGSYTHMVVQTRELSLASKPEKGRPNSNMEQSPCQSVSSIISSTSTGDKNESINSKTPRTFSVSVNILCQKLMKDLHYDFVCVAEITPTKQVRMFGHYKEDVESTIDLSFLCSVLKENQVKHWVPTSADATFATGDLISLHSDDPVTAREDGSSGFVGICLRKLVPKNKRPRSHEVVGFVRFRAAFRELLSARKYASGSKMVNEATEV